MKDQRWSNVIWWIYLWIYFQFHNVNLLIVIVIIISIISWVPNIQNFVLLRFSDSLSIANHCLTVSNYLLTVSSSWSRFSSQPNKVESSANNMHYKFTNTLHKSFIYKNRGPSTKPCGTPHVTLYNYGLVLFTLTYWYRSSK